MENRVVIYGAGKRGQVLYRELIESSNWDVVALIDKNAKHIQMNMGIEVQNPETLRGLVFDSLIVAIKDEKIAEDVRAFLLTEGLVDKNTRIYMNSWEILEQERFNSMRKKFVMKCQNSKTIFLMLLPEHGNLGDYAIGIAEKIFLETYFPDFHVTTVTEMEWDTIKETIVDVVEVDDVIAITGGGFLGDVWETGRRAMEIVDTFGDNKIVFFPQTLTYQDGVENNYRVAEDLRKIFARGKRLIIFREKKSYQTCCFLGYEDFCALAPDMGLLLDYRNLNNGEMKQRKALLCFRNDRERVFNYVGEIKKFLEESECIYAETDINLAKNIPEENGEDALLEQIKELQTYSIVFTDRLHGMILSWVAGVPVIAFDNTTKKVSGVYEWLKEDAKVQFCESIDDVEEAINNLGFFEETPRVQFEERFNRIACDIQKFIEIGVER